MARHHEWPEARRPPGPPHVQAALHAEPRAEARRGRETRAEASHALRSPTATACYHERATLSFAERLAAYAKSHSEAMADKGYIYHSTGDQAARGARRLQVGARRGERRRRASLESLEDAFMASRTAPQEHPSQGVRPRGRGHRSRRRSDLDHGHLLRLSRSDERERPRVTRGLSFVSPSQPTRRLVLVL